MERESFAFRKGPPEGGSFLRYESYVPGEGTNGSAVGASVPGASVSIPGASVGIERSVYDSALRADSLEFEPLPPLTPSENRPQGFISANAPCYGEVALEWSIPGLVDIEDQILEVDPFFEGPIIVPVRAVVVYSPDGAPQTIRSGRIVAESSTRNAYIQRDAPQGRWAYYTLFAQYYDVVTGKSYYDRLASTGVLVPRDYGTTEMLWSRIPLHYRLLDERLAEPLPPGSVCGREGERWGPLRKFISILGFELDRIRTISDMVVLSRDPQLGPPGALDRTAQMLSVPVRSSDLGDQRLRKLLTSISFLRQAKGTSEAVRLYLRALIGADVTIFENGEIRVHSQRVNYVPNPKVLGPEPRYDWRPARIDEVLDPRPFNYLQNRITGDKLSDPFVTYYDEYEYANGLWKFIPSHVDSTLNVEDIRTLYYLLGAVAPADLTSDEFLRLLSDANEQLIAEFTDDRSFLVGQLWRFDLEIPARDADRIVFSSAGFGGQRVVWGRLINADTGDILGVDGRPFNITDDPGSFLLTDEGEELIGVTPDPVRPISVPGLGNYIEMPVYIDERFPTKDGWAKFNVEVLVDLRKGGWTGDRLLVERNYFGEYFDGDTERGGWLVGSPLISDFRWDGEPDDSLSLYTEDYERTRQFVELAYRDLLPITTERNFTLTRFDFVGGTEEVLPELRE